MTVLAAGSGSQPRAAIRAVAALAAILATSATTVVFAAGLAATNPPTTTPMPGPTTGTAVARWTMHGPSQPRDLPSPRPLPSPVRP